MTFTSLQQDYLGGGLAAAIPSAATLGLTIPPGSCAFYFATDTNVLYRLAGGDVAWQVAAGGGGGSGAVELIAIQALGADAASISFNSIPGTYNHLELITSLGSVTNNGTSADRVFVEFNGDTTGSNYSRTYLGTYGGGTGFGFTDGIFAATDWGTPGLSPSSSRTLLTDYAAARWAYLQTASNFYQTDVGIVQGIGTSVWKNTAAITDIVLKFVSGVNFKAGSTAWLYGIT